MTVVVVAISDVSGLNVSIMRFPDLYRQSLEQIAGEGDDGIDTTLIIDSDQIPIFIGLMAEGLLNLRNLSPSTLRSPVRSSNPARSFEIVFGDVNRVALQKRSEQYVRLPRDHEDYFENLYSKNVMIRRGDFVHYTSGLITYKGEIFKLTKNLSFLFSEMLDNYYNDFISSDQILEAGNYQGKVRSDDSATARDSAALRVITPLKKIVDETVGHEAITRHSGGWRLKFQEPSN
jgi:hypothetical protein